jgi:DNA-binding response OmpR family regulator
MFYDGLTRKGYQVKLVPSGVTALEWLEEETPHLVIVNAASMRTSGRRICKSIHEFAASLSIILIVEANTETVNNSEANIILEIPFTLQKLLNRIKLLVPPEDQNLFTVGPIKLDLENNWVRCHEKHSSLTPRLVSILKALMENPGEVFERTKLFQLVWETGYTGDTRTLDVHISWLRQAIEEDPRHPEFIKTVRGIGYRLDIDSYFQQEFSLGRKKKQSKSAVESNQVKPA